jgi:AmmeMemoRadiSam system protein B
MRRSTIAGSWYPGDRRELTELIGSLLEQADIPDVSGRLFGLIAPHAGIQFSGRAAACAYRLLRGRDINRVILIGPSHYQNFRGLAVSGVDAYETPLGTIAVDRARAEALSALPLFQGPSEAEFPEHSLEMHVPFLQTVLPDCELLPIVTGHMSGFDCVNAARGLTTLIDKRTIVAASSDFTHYGRRFGYVPFKDDVREKLRKLDTGAIDCILQKNCEAFLDYLEKTGATICGATPIALLLHMLPPEARGTLLTYCTSGDILGDYTDTVSYASLVFMMDSYGRCFKKAPIWPAHPA